MTTLGTTPGDERSIQVLGYQVRYFTAGTGPAVVLLHGLGESAIAWYRNLLPLAEHFTVYATDLLGHGRSGKLRERPTVQLGVDFIAGFMDALGIEAAHLVGNSMGGMLAGWTAIQHPARVRSLVLEDAAGLGRGIAPFLRVMSVPLIGEAIARPSRANFQRLLRVVLHDPSTMPQEMVEALYEERGLPGNVSGMLRMLRVGVTPLGVKPAVRFDRHLRSLQIPALLIWGRQDAIVPVAQAEAAARASAVVELRILEACGHWPHIERADEFNALVAEFLMRGAASKPLEA